MNNNKSIDKNESKSLISIHNTDNDDNKTIVSNSRKDPDFLKQLEESLVHLIDPEIKKIFQLYDKNDDNTIDINELDELLFTLNIYLSVETLEEVMKEFDTNKNGVLDYEEFKQLYLFQLNRLKRISELEKAFRLYDRNGDGLISKEEFRKTLLIANNKLDENYIEELFNEFDEDKDGNLDYNEFVNSMPKEMGYYL